MVKKEIVIFILICIFSMSGCATVNGFKEDIGINNKTSSHEVKKAKEIPKGSLFSKISIGMSRMQIIDLIGNPSDFNTFSTGKQYIPFYHGRDVVRQVLYYKHEGRLTLSQTNKVVDIDYDPTEDGYH